MAEIVERAKSEQYTIFDFDIGDLVLSVTSLNPTKSTNGHSHEWGEAYFILEGVGIIEIDGKPSKIVKGDFIQIHGGQFHKVFNIGSGNLNFICAWVKYDG